MSPLVIGALSSCSSLSRPNADNLPGSKPAPTVAAPAASIPFLRNFLRLELRLNTLVASFILVFSFLGKFLRRAPEQNLFEAHTSVIGFCCRPGFSWWRLGGPK